MPKTHTYTHTDAFNLRINATVCGHTRRVQRAKNKANEAKKNQLKGHENFKTKASGQVKEEENRYGADSVHWQGFVRESGL